jgi:hypothetical protein
VHEMDDIKQALGASMAYLETAQTLANPI